jgi:hypothetical protein
MKAEFAGLFGKQLAGFLEPVFRKRSKVGADFGLGGICGHGFESGLQSDLWFEK